MSIRNICFVHIHEIDLLQIFLSYSIDKSSVRYDITIDIYFSVFKRELEIVVDYEKEKYTILEKGEIIYSKKINDINKEFKDIINITIPNILHKIIDK